MVSRPGARENPYGEVHLYFACPLPNCAILFSALPSQLVIFHSSRSGWIQELAPRGALFHDLEFKVELFAAKDGREIKLPELSCEAKGWPSLVEIHEKLQTKRPPQICKAYMGSDGLEFGFHIKRKGRSRRNKAGEGVTVEVISVGRIGGPIRIRVVGSNNLQFATGLRDAVQLCNETENIGNMLDYMATDDLLKFVVFERIRKDPEIMNDIGMTPRIRVDADRSGEFVLTTADIQHAPLGCDNWVAVGHAISSCSKADWLALPG